jgi:hypothetical protein
VITSNRFMMIRSVLTALVVSAGASSTASALPAEGPFWHVGGAKLPAGTKKAITGKLTGSTPFQYGKISNKWLRITCPRTTPTGSIFNGTIHGEGEETITFEECNKTSVFEAAAKTGPYKEVTECKAQATIKTGPLINTLWYHTTNVGKTRTANEQGLLVAKTGGTLYKMMIAGLGCGVIEGIFKAEGSIAGEPLPENTEVLSGTFTFPTEQQKHVWQPKSSPEETQVEFKFAGTEADLVGEGEVKLENEERFGVFEK